MMKVLIAEDDRITRRMLEVILGEWGYETVSVRDGLEAWDALRHADGPCIALLDWLMPGIDGVEICRRIRAVPTRQPPYVIATIQAIVAGSAGRFRQQAFTFVEAD